VSGEKWEARNGKLEWEVGKNKKAGRSPPYERKTAAKAAVRVVKGML